MTIVYELHGGPYDGDFVGFQNERSELDVVLPALPFDVLLRDAGPMHRRTVEQAKGALIQPGDRTGRVGRYVARPTQPLVLEWAGER